jgi:phosphoribosylamine--glycine ligase
MVCSTMKILVVGSGGREHALCWKIAQSPLVEKIWCAPGNGGIAEVADCVDIPATDISGLINFAREEGVDLTIIGPEDPLCMGITDAFVEVGLKVFGPSKGAAQIEGDKAFARDLCRRHKIPSPSHWVFDDQATAMAFLDNSAEGGIVVKAAGLAAGKGVYVCDDVDQARAAVNECMQKSKFGDAGSTIVFEERLEGEELSIIALTDGQTIMPLEPARDHKPVFDGGKGPNTGGMGAFSPVDSVRGRMIHQIEGQILLPAIHGLNRERRAFKGFLYAGLMLTASGPRVLEFNARMGDPETQPLLMRLKSDLLPLLLHAAEGKLSELEPPEWDERKAVCVMACSGGYPGDYRKGVPIRGLDQVDVGPDLQVFHSGTQRTPNGEFVTAGGRVLAMCALGETVEVARERAYGELAKIEFQGIHFRKDIAE